MAQPLDLVFMGTPEFAAVWAEWLRFAQDRRTPMGEDAAARQLKLLAKLGAASRGEAAATAHRLGLFDAVTQSAG